MAKPSRLAEAAAFARKLLTDEHYQEQLRIRLMDGSLPSNIEALLYHYAYGKPVETLEVTDNRDIERMTDEELLAAERVLRSKLPEAPSGGRVIH